MTPRHAHTYALRLVLTMTLPDAAGQYTVLQLWHCACGAGMDLAYEADQRTRLLSYTDAMAQYDSEQRRIRVKTRIK